MPPSSWQLAGQVLRATHLPFPVYVFVVRQSCLIYFRPPPPLFLARSLVCGSASLVRAISTIVYLLNDDSDHMRCDGDLLLPNTNSVKIVSPSLKGIIAVIYQGNTS